MDEVWLQTVRMARDCGDISSLFPPGITRLWDLPHTLHTAIRMALYFLKFEEWSEKESEYPPKHLWLEPDKLKQWWREVRAAREAEMKGEPSVRDMPSNDALKEMFPGVNFG